MKYKRYRFETKEQDFRPVVFNPKYPWWCSGFSSDSFIIVAFLPKKESLTKYWPEAYNAECTEEEEIFFTSRFPKPEYFVEAKKR